MKKSLLLLIVAIFTLTTAFDANAWTDRNTFGLKGPVKAVYNQDGYSNWLSEFNYDGTLSELNNNDWAVSRDKKGRLIKFSMMGTQGYSFTYNAKGQLIKLHIWAGAGTDFTRTFTYNTKGQIIKQNWDGEITTYTYQKFDKYGNWTKRTAKTGRKSRVETRTITYYE